MKFFISFSGNRGLIIFNLGEFFNRSILVRFNAYNYNYQDAKQKTVIIFQMPLARLDISSKQIHYKAILKNSKWAQFLEKIKTKSSVR